MSSTLRERFFLPSVTLILLLISTLVILYLQGYRLNLNRQQGQTNLLKTTGLLSITSLPKSAAIYLNDKLTSTTDSTLTLDPGAYQVKILKDGYLPWQKTFQIKPEIVFTTAASLFRSVPNLEPLTLAGVQSAFSSSDGRLILYTVNSSANPSNNGLYLYQTDSGLSLLNSNPKLLLPNTLSQNWTKFNFEISPDHQSALAYSPQTTYLISLSASGNIKPMLVPNSTKLQEIKQSWQETDQALLANKLVKLPKALLSFVATNSSNSLLFDSNQEKLIFQSSATGVLPPVLSSFPPARSTQVETRSLVAGHFYVYDLVDDTNFSLSQDPSPTNFRWVPDGNNILYSANNTVYVQDYDNTNLHKLYAGNFQADILSTSSDGKRIVLLTSPYPGAQDNLYSITIR